MPYIPTSTPRPWIPKRKPFEGAKRIEGIYNTTRWRKLSLLYRTEHPLCEPCQAKGITKVAEMTDHRKGFKDAGDPAAWDWENLQAICRECHNRKSAKDAKRKAQHEQSNEDDI